MSEIREVDPSSIPDEDFGAATGRAMAAKMGDAYQNLESDPVMAPQSKPNGNGKMNGRNHTVEVPGIGSVEMGPPPFATALMAGKVVGLEQAQDMMAIAYARAMLYVRKINGQEVSPVRTPEGLQHLMNQLGDQVVDLCVRAYTKYWPPISTSDLPL